MKDQLSSLDVYLLVEELKEFIPARVQKIYDLRKKGIEFNFYPFQEKEKKKLMLVPPTYFFLQDSSPSHPKHPSSFVMLLRKHLENGTITEIRQHKLDRILELKVEKEEKKFYLILEFFSKGNVFLCDGKKEILGLREWQKWKHRTLGVGKKYKYPPPLPNPFQLNFPEFKEILQESSKTLIATLVVDLNLGKVLSEEICLKSGVDKKENAGDLTLEKYKEMFQSLQELLEKFEENEINPILVKKEKPVDVIPFDLEIYQDGEWKKEKFSTFHRAIAQHFTSQQKRTWKVKLEEKFQEKLEHLQNIKKDQKEVIENLKREESKNEQTAQVIYQNLPTVEKILKLAREKGEELEGEEVNGIKVKEINGNSILIEI